MTPRPFRALRFDPARVQLAQVLGGDGRDPRHVQRIVESAAAEGDGVDAPARRARLKLSEWQRAGVLRRDDAPALYLVRRRGDDDSEALGLFCALAVDEEVQAAPDAALARGVAVTPVVGAFSDDSGRVKRALDTAADREADATWKDGAFTFELFVLDEESTTARVATLISAGGLDIQRGRDLLAAHGAWWKAQQKSARDDDALVAGAHALAFLHLTGDAWESVPLGAAILPLGGVL